MCEITVNWDVSETSGTETITLEQMNVNSFEEWNGFSIEEKEEKIQEALDNLPERVGIVVESWC